MVGSSEKGTFIGEKIDDFKQSLLVTNQKLFEKIENAGSETSFRCSKCCICKLRKEHNQSEILSVREEVEQDVINKSAKVDIKNRVTTASILLFQNPSIKLAPNKDKTLQICNHQIKKCYKIKSKSSRQKRCHWIWSKTTQFGICWVCEKFNTRKRADVERYWFKELYTMDSCLEWKLCQYTMLHPLWCLPKNTL